MSRNLAKQMNKVTTTLRTRVKRDEVQRTQKPGDHVSEGLPELQQLGLADFVTMLNVSCGISTMFLCLNYSNETESEKHNRYLFIAFILIPVSVFCDFLDGYIARSRYSSPFGRDLDSLADLVSFGVSPTCMGFTLGLRGIWDSLIMCFFVACCMVRLARFNVRSLRVSDTKGRVPYYEGLPSPSSVLIIGMFFMSYLTGRVKDKIIGGEYYIYPGHFHPLSLIYLVFGLMMISKFRIQKPKF